MSREKLHDKSKLQHPLQNSLNVVIGKAFIKFLNSQRKVGILISLLLETAAYFFKIWDLRGLSPKPSQENYHSWYNFWYNLFRENNIYFAHYLLLIRDHIKIVEASILYFHLMEWRRMSYLFFLSTQWEALLK